MVVSAISVVYLQVSEFHHKIRKNSKRKKLQRLKQNKRSQKSHWTTFRVFVKYRLLFIVSTTFRIMLLLEYKKNSEIF